MANFVHGSKWVHYLRPRQILVLEVFHDTVLLKNPLRPLEAGVRYFYPEWGDLVDGCIYQHVREKEVQNA